MTRKHTQKETPPNQTNKKKKKKRMCKQQRRRFLNFVYAFLVLCNYLHLAKGVALYLSKFESPSPNDALCKVWLKFALWFCRRILNFATLDVFSLFRNYLPLKKGVTLHLNKLESLFTKVALCQIWLKSAQLFRRNN